VTARDLAHDLSLPHPSAPVDGGASWSKQDQGVLTTHAQIRSPRRFVGDTDRADVVQLRGGAGPDRRRVAARAIGRSRAPSGPFNL